MLIICPRKGSIMIPATVKMTESRMLTMYAELKYLSASSVFPLNMAMVMKRPAMEPKAEVRMAV